MRQGSLRRPLSSFGSRSDKHELGTRFLAAAVLLGTRQAGNPTSPNRRVIGLRPRTIGAACLSCFSSSSSCSRWLEAFSSASFSSCCFSCFSCCFSCANASKERGRARTGLAERDSVTRVSRPSEVSLPGCNARRIRQYTDLHPPLPTKIGLTAPVARKDRHWRASLGGHTGRAPLRFG